MCLTGLKKDKNYKFQPLQKPSTLMCLSLPVFYKLIWLTFSLKYGLVDLNMRNGVPHHTAYETIG